MVPEFEKFTRSKSSRVHGFTQIQGHEFAMNSCTLEPVNL